MGTNHILRVLKRGWRLLVVFAAVGLILGAVSASLADTEAPEAAGGIFAATASLRVDGELSVPVPSATQYLSDPVVAEEAAAAVGGDPAVLARHVVGTSNQGLNTINVTAVDRDATRAEDLANGFGDAFAARLVQLEADKNDLAATAAAERSTDLYARLQQAQAERDAAAEADRPPIQARYDALLKQYSAAEEQRQLAESRRDTLLVTVEREAIAEPITRENFDAYIQRVTGSSSKPGKNQPAPTPGALTLADALEPSTPPVPPNPLTRGLLGMMTGLILGGISLVGLDRIDPRVRSKEQAEEICGYPVVAEIPPLTRRQRLGTDVLTIDEPMSRAAEAYRVLRSAILFASSADDPSLDEPVPPKVLLVTSPGPSEGKTTTAANLAAVMAEAGYRVLVVNCDFRRPRVKDYLGGTDGTSRVSETRIPRVHLVDHVVPDEQLTNPAEMAAAQRRIVRTARDLFDVVILDTAPLLTTNDATELLGLADLVVLVAAAGKTNAAAAERAAELLERRRAKVLGLCLVGTADVPTARYYYYASDAGDAEPDRLVRRPAAPPTPQPGSGEDIGDELRRLSDVQRPTSRG